MDSLQTCVKANQTTMYIDVASIALLVFEYLLTVHDEISYVWQKRSGVTPAFILLCFTRYLAFVCVVIPFIPSQDSTHPHVAHILLEIIVIAGAELILALRTWAVWQKSRGMLVSLIILSMATLGFCIGFACWIFSTAAVLGSAECTLYTSATARLAVFMFLALILFEIVNISLTLYKMEEWRKTIPQATRSPLFYLVWRDGVVYFVFLLGLSIGNIALSSGSLLESPRALSQVQVLLHSMLATRSVIHLAKSSGSDESRTVMFTTHPTQYPNLCAGGITDSDGWSAPKPTSSA